MRGPTDADDFESWLKEGYHNRPAPRHDVAREMFEEEMSRRAAERQKAWERQEITALARRVRELERLLLAADGRPNGPLVRGLGDVTAKVIARERKSIDAMFAEERAKTVELIEKRIDAAFANRTTMFYKGIYSDQNEYGRGDVVTASGSLWMATDTVERGRKPGGPPWRLIVKAGQPTNTAPPPVVA